MRWPPNPWPSGNCLTSSYPNCFESQDAFSSGHVECTSLPHRSDVFLAVIGQQPLTLQFFLLSSCEPLFDPFVSLFRAYFIPFLALVHFSLFYTVKESSSSLRSRISYEIVSLAAEAVTTFTDFFFSRVATAWQDLWALSNWRKTQAASTSDLTPVLE